MLFVLATLSKSITAVVVESVNHNKLYCWDLYYTLNISKHGINLHLAFKKMVLMMKKKMLNGLDKLKVVCLTKKKKNKGIKGGFKFC